MSPGIPRRNITEIIAQNPFNLPEEWTEEKPWDVIHCFKCNQAWMIPSHVYQVWLELDFGCPYCTIKDAEEE